MKRQLLNFFSAFSALEEQNEIVKHVLCDRSNQDLYPIFQYIDQSEKGYIDKNDLKRILSPLNAPDSDYLELAQSWSRSSSGHISYKDFIFFILPLNYYPKPINPNSQEISHDLKYSIQRIFQKELEFLQNFIDIASKFKHQVNKSLLITFDLITKGKNSFNRDDLESFLNDNGVKCSQSIIFAMFRRIDKDGDGTVSISDFVDCFCKEKEFGNLKASKSVKGLMDETRETLSCTGRNSQRIPKNAENSLKKLIKGLIQQEKELDKYREAMCFRADFTIKAVFSLFDKKKRQTISELDFERGLREFNIKTSANNIFLIYRHYDCNNDGLLTFTNFSEILSPRSQVHKNLLNNRGTFQLSQETKSFLTQIFLLIIELEQNADRLRKQLSSQSCTLIQLFRIIDKSGRGIATINEFREVLKQYKIQPTINDLNSLVSRFDTNRDGKVTFSEFFEQVTPKVSRLEF